jgi:hypothetical protein
MVDALFRLPLVVTDRSYRGAVPFALVGLHVVRRRVPPHCAFTRTPEFGGSMVQSVMVFYGSRWRWIAVNVFQTYADLEDHLTGRTTLAALYRDVSGYPEPARSCCRSGCATTDYVIHEAWPPQQHGVAAWRGASA